MCYAASVLRKLEEWGPLLALATLLVTVLLWLDGKQEARLGRIEGRLTERLERIEEEQSVQGKGLAEVRGALNVLIAMREK